MSAIKKTGIKTTCFSIFLLLIFSSCNKKTGNIPVNTPDKITFISVSDIGGSQGNYSIIKVTKDSVRLEKGIADLKIHKQWSAGISSRTWEQLMSSFDIRTLNKIKSSPSKQSVDGIDEIFQIRTTKNSHIYVNSYIDTIHYKQFENFKIKLNKILPKEYQ